MPNCRKVLFLALFGASLVSTGCSSDAVEEIAEDLNAELKGEPKRDPVPPKPVGRDAGAAPDDRACKSDRLLPFPPPGVVPACPPVGAACSNPGETAWCRAPELDRILRCTAKGTEVTWHLLAEGCFATGGEPMPPPPPSPGRDAGPPPPPAKRDAGAPPRCVPAPPAEVKLDRCPAVGALCGPSGPSLLPCLMGGTTYVFHCAPTRVGEKPTWTLLAPACTDAPKPPKADGGAQMLPQIPEGEPYQANCNVHQPCKELGQSYFCCMNPSAGLAGQVSCEKSSAGQIYLTKSYAKFACPTK